MQGVAFVERLCLSHLADLGADTSGALSFTGGATNSELWNQTRVDVLGREARLPRYPEAAFGMAVIAASHGGSVADTAERMVTQYRTITPREGMAARWHEPYLAMVDQLERRGYIRSSLARAARAA
jgi:sugar (pentulose or hexulose) kinase